MWQIRVDVHMLNNDGNLMDAASIAAITALSHFRRPDVGIQGEEVTVVSRHQPPWTCAYISFLLHDVLVVILCLSPQYSPEERDPIPLSIYHMPISVSFAFFQQG